VEEAAPPPFAIGFGGVIYLEIDSICIVQSIIWVEYSGDKGGHKRRNGRKKENVEPVVYMGMTGVQIYVTKLQDYTYFDMFLRLKNFNPRLSRYWKDKLAMPAFALGPKWCFGLSEGLSMKSSAKLLAMLTFCDGVRTRGVFGI
jgi:hypothetical protein